MKLKTHQKSNFHCLVKVYVFIYPKNWLKIWIGKLSDVIIKNRSYKAFKCCFKNWFSSFNNGQKKTRTPTLILFLPYKCWSKALLQCMSENYGKKWATLFKSHLSSSSGSDFIKPCFKAVKIDFGQLQPPKMNCLGITIFKF